VLNTGPYRESCRPHLVCFNSHGTRFARVVILDVAMPGLNGIEVASILQRLQPDVPMILHTIYGDHVGQAFGAVFGIRAVVAKSDGISRLIECVQSLLNPQSDQP
jgi:DNA-binding NarL/FixJ family response regulator